MLLLLSEHAPAHSFPFYVVSSVLAPILQTSRVRHEEIGFLAQVHMAIQVQSWALTQVCLPPESLVPLIIKLLS